MDNVIPGLRNAYIKYGSPSIDNVINKFEKKEKIKEKRLHKLISYLELEGKKYDEKIPLYKKYINEGGDLNKIVEDADLEYSLVHKTNYLHYLKYNDTKTAKYLATMEFVNSGKRDGTIEKIILKNNTLKF